MLRFLTDSGWWILIKFQFDVSTRPATIFPEKNTMLTKLIGHRVIALTAQRITANNTRQGQNPAPAPAMALKRIDGIFRTTRQMPTTAPNQRRQRQLIRPDDAFCYFNGYGHGALVLGLRRCGWFYNTILFKLRKSKTDFLANRTYADQIGFWS